MGYKPDEVVIETQESQKPRRGRHKKVNTQGKASSPKRGLADSFVINRKTTSKSRKCLLATVLSGIRIDRFRYWGTTFHSTSFQSNTLPLVAG